MPGQCLGNAWAQLNRAVRERVSPGVEGVL